MKRGFAVAGFAALIGCASNPPATDVAAANSTAEIEIAPVQPSPPATTSAAVLATAAPLPAMSLCDEFWIRMRECMRHSLKTADPGTLEVAMKALADAEQSAREAQAQLDFAQLEAACQAMFDSLAQNPTCPQDAR